MALESKTYFLSLIKKFGLAELSEQIIGLGASTARQFAFISAYVPGAPSDAAFIDEVITPLLGNDHSLKTALKCLHFECYTLMAHSAQQALLGDDENKIKKLPGPVRVKRLEEIRKRLHPGIKVIGELEPSHALINKFHNMLETG
eukprot:1745559-Karenia_brevis.AAC.1